MNRFTVLGLLQEAAFGQRIAIVASNADTVECIRRVDDLDSLDVSRIVRTNGNQAIHTHQGGELRFCRGLSDIRGRRFDVVAGPRSVFDNEDDRLDLIALGSEFVVL